MAGRPIRVDLKTALFVCDQGHVTEEKNWSAEEMEDWGGKVCRPSGLFCGRLNWKIENAAIHTVFAIAGEKAATDLWRVLPKKERK